MDWKRMAVAGLKREREGLAARLSQIDAALAVFDGAAPVAAKTQKRTRAKKEMTPEQKEKRQAAMQAAHDAMAVKRGKASPEQIERHNKRLQEKALNDPAKRAEARMSPGASLREATAS